MLRIMRRPVVEDGFADQQISGGNAERNTFVIGVRP